MSFLGAGMEDDLSSLSQRKAVKGRERMERSSCSVGGGGGAAAAADGAREERAFNGE